MSLDVLDRFSVTFSYPHNWNLTEHFVDSLTHLILHETGKKKSERILGSILKEGSCYVHANRGRIVSNFLNYSQDSYLLMVDPDISFPRDILEQFKKLVEYYKDKRPGIIAARVNIRNGLPVFYYQNPEDPIATIQYCYPFSGIKEFEFVGTGIILLERSILYDMYLREGNTHYFNCLIEPETGRLLGDDFSFCKVARKYGHKIYGAWDIVGIHHKDYPILDRYPSKNEIMIKRT